MNKLTKSLLQIIFILFIISLAFSLFSGVGTKIQKISFSQLVDKVKNNDVDKVLVRQNNLTVTLKDGQVFTAEKEPESGLTENLKNYGIPEETIAKLNIDVQGGGNWAFVSTILLPILLPFLLLIVFFWLITRKAEKGAMQVFSFNRANVKIFGSEKDKITFNEVAGLHEAKEELREIVEFLKNPKKFLDIGAKIPRGVLLMGPPGSGKTLLARAVAGEANVPFFHISGSEFVEMFVGVGASRVRDLFTTAKKEAPAIIFIDEIDAVGRERGAGLGGGHDEREQTLNQILVEMDGFDRETRLIVMAATNRPDILDVALLRPGRFDRRIVLDLPDINDRVDVLKIHFKGKNAEPSINLRQIAERTPGFSGADLANLVNEGAILAARRNKKTISQQELLESIEKVILGPERKSHILTQREKEITAYHEAGHALVATSLPHCDPVQKISIIARGRAAGYTLKLPIEDKHLKTKSEFLADIAATLGGYAAEEIVFKEISTGAASDLNESSEMIRALVTRYGMSDKLGPVVFGKTEGLVFLGREIATEKNYSETVATQIDEEVARITKEAHQKAKKILAKRRTKLNQIAKVLIEKETIEKEEFEQIMKK